MNKRGDKMNISYLKNKNIHFVECKDWHDVYGYEKSEMKEDIINYIEQLQQENKQLKEKLDKYKEVISKFKDLKTLIGILNSNNLRFSFNEILQELEKGDSNE